MYVEMVVLDGGLQVILLVVSVVASPLGHVALQGV